MTRLTIDDQIALLLMDRPEQRNALTPVMLTALAIKARQAADEARVLVLGGEGKTFCAGFDLGMCREAEDGSVLRDLLSGLSALVQTLRELPIPVVARVHGAAIAGGCALLGGADVVLVERSAKVGYPVVRLGISPAVSAPFMEGLPGGTRERLLDPLLVEGEEAVRIGFAHEVCEDREALFARSDEVAHALAAKPGAAIAETKAWVSRLSSGKAVAEHGDGPNEAVTQALDVSLSLVGSHEQRELLEAFWAGRESRQ